MKSNRVATQNAGKFKTGLQIVKNSGLVLLMSLLLVTISCDKSDDFEPIRNESPINNESPSENETPPEDTPPEDTTPEDTPPDETPPDETPPDETPPDNEPPNDDESVIIYTDIEPDFTSQNLKDSYNLDLNNDKIIDFTVSSDSDIWEEWLWITSNPIANNGIMSITPWYSYAVPLDSGKEIFNLRGYRNGESYETWGVLGNCIAGEIDCFFDWKNKVDKYLGLRFTIKGQTHYGWARLEVLSLTHWVIKDFAYNATPNKPILAGHMN